MKNFEKRPRVKANVAVSFSHFAYPENHDGEEDWFPPCYLQIAKTLGLKTKYAHPEIETLITFCTDNLGYSVLKQLITAVKNGERFSHGDRTMVTGSFYWEKDVTVEFREVKSPRGAYLRAVVLGLEEDFQSLSEEEAESFLNSLSPLIDPCDYV